MATVTPDTKRTAASIVRQVLAAVALVVGSLQDAQAIPGKYGWILQLVGGGIFVVEHALNGNEIIATPSNTPELQRLQASLALLVTNLNQQKGNTP